MDSIRPLYQVRRSTRRHTFSIKVSDAHGVVVYAPQRASDRQIACFVLSKREWLAKAIRRVNEIRDRNQLPAFMDRKDILYRGHRHQLIFATGAGTEVCCADGCITVTVPAQPTIEAFSELLWKTLMNWLLQDAMTTLSEMLRTRAAQMEVSWRMASIKAMKSRWGSCSMNGNISLHWALVMAPPVVADYVVVHELAHRTHMNHSEEFWSYVARYLPDYKVHRKWLKQNGWELKL